MFYDPKWDKKVKEIEQKDRWRQVLLDAADLIERKGWTQRNFSKRGSYCLVGAINKVLGRQPTNDNFSGKRANSRLAEEAITQLSLELSVIRTFFVTPKAVDAVYNWNDDEERKVEPKAVDAVYNWNDDKERKVEDVINFLRKVATK